MEINQCVGCGTRRKILISTQVSAQCEVLDDLAGRVIRLDAALREEGAAVCFVYRDGARGCVENQSLMAWGARNLIPHRPAARAARS